MGDFTVTTDLASLTDDNLANLYEEVGFGTASMYLRNRDFVKRAFPTGTYGFFVWHPHEQRQLLGMARVMSDDFLCTWIAEICVAPRAQNGGIGTALLKAVIERFGHTAIYVETFERYINLLSQAGITPKSKLFACSRAAAVRVPDEPAEASIH